MLIEKDTQQNIKAYLAKEHHPGLVLIGEKGIGKRLIADDIAKNLLGVENLETCPDYLVVESVNGSILIEQLNELKKRTLYCAVTVPFKVFVIDDADTMNSHSQNSLLKILEDGNDTNLFIFVAHKPLIETIHSRCETIRVNNPTDDEIKAFLTDNGVVADETIMCIADNRIGLYQQMITDKKYVEDCKSILNRFLTMQKKRELLEAFGLVKEKDGDSFYDGHSVDKVLMFVKYMKEMYKEVLYDYIGHSNGIDYTAVKKQYDCLKCINIISVIDQHVDNMKNKGHYTRNDFFDLVRYMV
jgi:replication-associated recombination protein RarA